MLHTLPGSFTCDNGYDLQLLWHQSSVQIEVEACDLNRVSHSQKVRPAWQTVRRSVLENGNYYRIGGSIVVM